MSKVSVFSEQMNARTSVHNKLLLCLVRVSDMAIGKKSYFIVMTLQHSFPSFVEILCFPFKFFVAKHWIRYWQQEEENCNQNMFSLFVRETLFVEWRTHKNQIYVYCDKNIWNNGVCCVLSYHDSCFSLHLRDYVTNKKTGQQLNKSLFVLLFGPKLRTKTKTFCSASL